MFLPRPQGVPRQEGACRGIAGRGGIGERFVANLHRAYSELAGDPPGTPLPMPTIMPDLIAYNGGQMPQCLA